MILLSEAIRHNADVLKTLTIVLSVALMLQAYPPERTDIVLAEPKPNPYYKITEPIEALEQPELVKIEQVSRIEPKPAPASPKSISGNKQDWMRQAGIPESDWQWVDYIVTKESSWNPSARGQLTNVMHNGKLIQDRACGLAQSLPCIKVGANWDDPVVSLKWQHNYVKGRYGSYKGAYDFWVANKWY